MTNEWFRMVASQALANTEMLEATYDLARSLVEREIDGDFVECGVFTGSQAAIMAKALIDFDDAGLCNRKVHLFDSFQGIPVAGEHDEELQGKPAGISACPLSRVMDNMRAWGIPQDLLVIHPGFFEKTVPKAAGDTLKEIAFLRLDGDLYSSTKVCMEHLYPLVVQGGWVCVDDFNLSGARKAVLEVCVPAPVYWRVPTK